jgi:hypothetical protein
MPLRLPPPPPEGMEIINAALEGLISTSVPAARAMSAVVEGGTGLGLTATAPLLVYFLGLDDLARGRGVSAAWPTSWRYILLEGDRPHAAAEVAISDYGVVEGFSHLDKGPFVESLVAGVAFAERLEADQGGDFEARLLSAPSLYLVALWLHGESDLFVPLDPAPDGLDPERAYTEEQLFSSLRELIELRTNFKDPIP